jgi:mono/diheme cytochrome c family protein
MGMLRRRQLRGLIIAGLALFGFFCVLTAQAEGQQQELIARGKVTYRVYCRNCHGDLGKGDGKLVDILRVKPADLTQITRKNDGDFPFDRIYRIIDGREEVASHGDMPIWGKAFQESTGNEDETRGKILQLIEFLKSIQDGATKQAAARPGS